MKPRIIRLGIFLLLWFAYFGAEFISFASKKISTKSYSNLVLSISEQEEFKAASENHIKLLKEMSERKGPVADIVGQVERIKHRQAIFFYAALSVWFYLCTWLFYFFFIKARTRAD
jgi:hypothetical protein